MVGGEQRLDVIVEHGNERLIVERMKPVGATIEDQERDIRKRAWTQTSALAQMHLVAQFAALPFLMVAPGWNGGEIAFGMTTAASGCTDDQHAATRPRIDHPPIDALNHVAFEPFCHAPSFSRSQATTSRQRFTRHKDVTCPERRHARVSTPRPFAPGCPDHGTDASPRASPSPDRQNRSAPAARSAR